MLGNGSHLHGAQGKDVLAIRRSFTEAEVPFAPGHNGPVGTDMITFDAPRARFNFRVGGVCVHQDRVLLLRISDADLRLYPAFLKDSLQSMPEHTGHVVEHDVNPGDELEASRQLEPGP